MRRTLFSPNVSREFGQRALSYVPGLLLIYMHVFPLFTQRASNVHLAKETQSKDCKRTQSQALHCPHLGLLLRNAIHQTLLLRCDRTEDLLALKSTLHLQDIPI